MAAACVVLALCHIVQTSAITINPLSNDTDSLTVEISSDVTTTDEAWSLNATRTDQWYMTLLDLNTVSHSVFENKDLIEPNPECILIEMC